MKFDLTEERQMLQDSLRRFLADRVDPKAIAEGEEGWSRETWTGMAELGLIGALFTEEQGGFGGHGFDLGVVFEELGRAGATEPLLEAALAGELIARRGDEGQRALIEEVIAGGVQLAFAHGEPGSRFDPTRVTVTGGAALDGRKAVVVNGGQADRIVVSARTGGEPRDEGGISLYLIPADLPGLEIRDYPLQGGGRAAELSFDGAAIPDGALLGGEGDAWPDIEAALARATAAHCAEALGMIERCLAMTAGYLKERKQFGKPLSSFQALQHRMADMAIEVEQARSAVINLTGRLGEARDVRERHVSATKHLIGEVARLVVEESVQLHGGIGMTQEYDLAHFARRLTMVDHRFGDALYHLGRFSALGR